VRFCVLPRARSKRGFEVSEQTRASSGSTSVRERPAVALTAAKLRLAIVERSPARQTLRVALRYGLCSARRWSKQVSRSTLPRAAA
jgi:hypothetical protein